jgi:hypothetical protein
MKATSAPLLTIPAKRVTCKAASKKRDASTDGTMPKSRKSTRLANRSTRDMTMEEQATALLMKKCNFLEKKQQPDDQAKIMFCSLFANPMPRKEVTQYRTMFNLEEAGGTNILSAVAVHSEG